MQKATKEKITKAVREYIRVFPDEYYEFKRAHKVKVDLQRDKFASTKGDHVQERLLHEVPETLFIALKKNLTDTQWEEFESKEGSRWFAKEFKAFSVAQEI